MDDECGADGGMIGKETRIALGELVAVPLCLPQIPHDLNWARTRATTVGSRQLTV
jgi:hypothetical protein